MNATRHFQARTRQRCISSTMVELILEHGSTNGKGDLTLLGTRDIDQAIEILRKQIRELERMRSRGGAGIAHDGETLVTAFHRNKKFRRS